MLAVGAALCASAPVSHAQPGTSFTYQGVLTSAGTNVDNAVMVDFKLFDADVAGSQVGSTISSTITPANGVFSESLDFGVNAYAPNQALWLEITVEGDVLGRQKLEATPFALNTRGVSVSSTGRVGIGTDTPTQQLDIRGGLRVGDGVTPEQDINFYSLNGAWQLGTNNTGSGIDNNHFYIWDDSYDDYILSVPNGSRRVGINTTAPETTLDVNGVASVDMLEVDGEAFVGSNNINEQGVHILSLNGEWEIGSNVSGSGTDSNQFYIYDHFSDRYALTAQKGTGRIGIGTTSPATSLDVNGAVTIRGGADIVEGFETATTDVVEPGTLMVIDPENPGKLMLSTQAYDAKVAGVVSGANGVNPGIKLGQDGVMDGDLPVAMTGRVYVKCSAENGPVMPGDRLTTSSIPGHAMKATDSDRSDGAVIGKAMTSLDAETGMVLVLVNLQ